MDHIITTNLDLATSLKVVDKAFEEQKAKFPQYSPEFAWTGEQEGVHQGSFRFKPTPSMEIQGALYVEPNKVAVKFGKLPFLAQMFKGQAIKMVEKEVEAWVAKAKAGEI